MAQQVSKGIYDLDYYNSSQSFLYIGDVLIDEVTSLQYVTQQEKTPIYGYASQLFDTTSAGRVLVTGSFTINFKEQGYLWAVLRRYFQIQSSITGISTAQQDAALLNNKEPIVTGSNATKMSRLAIERLIEGNLTKTERYKFYNELAGYATIEVDSPKDRTFEDIMDAFEDEIWQTEETNDTLNSQIRRTDANVFDNFDIHCIWGNYAQPNTNHTVQKIIGVRLTSQGKRIMIGDGPIQEEYSFIAQSVV